LPFCFLSPLPFCFLSPLPFCFRRRPLPFCFRRRPLPLRLSRCPLPFCFRRRLLLRRFLGGLPLTPCLYQHGRLLRRQISRGGKPLGPLPVLQRQPRGWPKQPVGNLNRVVERHQPLLHSDTRPPVQGQRRFRLPCLLPRVFLNLTERFCTRCRCQPVHLRRGQISRGAEPTGLLPLPQRCPGSVSELPIWNTDRVVERREPALYPDDPLAVQGQRLFCLHPPGDGCQTRPRFRHIGPARILLQVGFDLPRPLAHHLLPKDIFQLPCRLTPGNSREHQHDRQAGPPHSQGNAGRYSFPHRLQTSVARSREHMRSSKDSRL